MDKERLEAARAALAASVARWADIDGEPYHTTIPALKLFRRATPSGPVSCLCDSGIALIVQGGKQVLLGTDTYTYDACRFLITSVNLPAIAEVTDASPEKPYLSL